MCVCVCLLGVFIKLLERGRPLALAVCEESEGNLLHGRSLAHLIGLLGLECKWQNV